MSLCAELNERNTKKLTFKLIFSLIMTIMSLMIYPQSSLFNPYQIFVPTTANTTISVYLVAESPLETRNDLNDIKDVGISNVLIMYNSLTMNTTDVYNVTNFANNLDLSVGLSIGGTLSSDEEYMSDAYKSDLRLIVGGLISEGVFNNIDTIEFLPYINAPEEYGSYSSNPLEMLFGATKDDVNFLKELILMVSNFTLVETRTTVHMSYSRTYRTILSRLDSIEQLDQIGVSIFQSHINTIPTALSSGIEQIRTLTTKEAIVGQIGFSTHDDVHNIFMQDTWFWSCLDVASSLSVNEVSVWQWKNRPFFPFIVTENLEPQYGIKDKPIVNSIQGYITDGNINYIGYSTNIFEVVLGTFSTSGSTGVISGNILLSIIFRILLGILIGRKCKLNGRFLGLLLFGIMLGFHFSMGVVILNSPVWWVVFATYFYLYASITAGVYQIQIVSTIVRHRKVFDFCDVNDAKKCTLEFLQKE